MERKDNYTSYNSSFALGGATFGMAESYTYIYTDGDNIIVRILDLMQLLVLNKVALELFQVLQAEL